MYLISLQSLSVNPNDRQRLISGSPAPHAMRQSAQQLQTGAPSDHAKALWRKGIPQSPKISVSSAETDEEDEEEYSSQLDKLVEVKGVGVAVSHPALELDQNAGRKPPNTPMPHLSANKHNGNNSLVLWRKSQIRVMQFHSISPFTRTFHHCKNTVC